MVELTDIEAAATLHQPSGAAVTLDFRPAALADGDSVANVYLRSRRELVACASLAHSDEDVREWIRRVLIPAGGATVAVADGLVVGLLAVSTGPDGSWIDQLYVLPEWVGRGIGSRLLDLARRELLLPIRLYTFQCNQRARCFYESRGFRAIAFGDGSANEEKRPDILYEWRPGRSGGWP
jgi:ribosomal protein S18 acetylase RimI-like enzyme